MAGMAIWITGLPGSGKSALADAVKGEFPGFVVLRMDDLRKVATPEPSYSDAERDLLYRSLVFTARVLTEHGHDVIIDATGNLRKWREAARGLIGRFAEIYLKCPLEVCRKREKYRGERRSAPPGVYEKGERGWPVPGLSAPYEEPLSPELTLDASALTVQEEMGALREFIDRWLASPEGVA
jgi:adenylylsulfate kinase